MISIDDFLTQINKNKIGGGLVQTTGCCNGRKFLAQRSFNKTIWFITPLPTDSEDFNKEEMKEIRKAVREAYKKEEV